VVKFTVDKNKENPYVMLNKTPLSDNRISWRAKGIWAYLLSKPDNWTVREKDLMNKSTEGRDAVRAAIKELVENGYIVKTEIRDKGKYIGVEYSVFETPIELPGIDPSPEKPSTVEMSSSAQPLPEKPSTVKPTTANPPHSNTNVTNKQKNNKRTTTVPLVTSKPVPVESIAVVAPILKKMENDPVIPVTDLPKGIKPALVNKLISVHGQDAVIKQVKNLKATLTTKKINNVAGWLTTAVCEGFDSKVELDLFKVQDNKELESELVAKLESVSSAPHEIVNPEFMQELIGKYGCVADYFARAGN